MKWISVKDRLPETCEDESSPVLVATKNGTYLILIVVDVKINTKDKTWKWTFVNGKDLFHTIAPKYWMPLPELPKEIEEEER